MTSFVLSLSEAEIVFRKLFDDLFCLEEFNHLLLQEVDLAEIKKIVLQYFPNCLSLDRKQNFDMASKNNYRIIKTKDNKYRVCTEAEIVGPVDTTLDNNYRVIRKYYGTLLQQTLTNQQ